MINKIGDLKVWAVRNGIESKYNVDSPEGAITLINNLADADLKNDDIDYNAFGLIVYEADGWNEWTNEDGEDINEIMYSDNYNQ